MLIGFSKLAERTNDDCRSTSRVGAQPELPVIGVREAMFGWRDTQQVHPCSSARQPCRARSRQPTSLLARSLIVSDRASNYVLQKRWLHLEAVIPRIVHPPHPSAQ